MTKPKFTLRFLLLFVTVLGIAFGWLFTQLNVVRQRRAFVNELTEKWQVVDQGRPFSLRAFAIDYETAKRAGLDVSKAPSDSIGATREFLGDRTYFFVAL